MNKKQISWKKSIKYLQILFFIFIIIWYNLYNYTVWVYNEYNRTIDKLNEVSIKVQVIEEDIKKLEKINENLKNIKLNKDAFIDAYNKCYADYSLKKYNIWTWNIVSLKNCIWQLYTSSDIADFKDIDLEKIWISFWLYEDRSWKLSFDQKRFLASLDQNIFMDNLEKKVPLLSFSNPILVDKELWLYKVTFTFATNLSYASFINTFNRLQNMLHKENNLYYTIDSIWEFDIMNESQEQKVNVQWSFYFSRQ